VRGIKASFLSVLAVRPGRGVRAGGSVPVTVSNMRFDVE
jgi:hypothetical protein